MNKEVGNNVDDISDSEWWTQIGMLHPEEEFHFCRMQCRESELSRAPETR